MQVEAEQVSTQMQEAAPRRLLVLAPAIETTRTVHSVMLSGLLQRAHTPIEQVTHQEWMAKPTSAVSVGNLRVYLYTRGAVLPVDYDYVYVSF